MAYQKYINLEERENINAICKSKGRKLCMGQNLKVWKVKMIH